MVKTIKIVVDDQIPLIDELFADAVVIKKPGQEIQAADLADADMLWVRTITRVDAQLLRNSSVRFVGTATAGFDHLDTAWLDQHGIAWACAPGANAMAVAEYVLCVIAALRSQGILNGSSLRAGVIGVGRVGSLVARYLTQIGLQVLVNDPPRESREPDFHSTPLSELNDLDLLCVHPALVRYGAHPSYHLLGPDFFQRQKPEMVLLNASRGSVLDTNLLLNQPHLRLCLDVWEDEPEINLNLLARALIATPHIAGYSINAKRQASLLLYQQAKVFFGLPERAVEQEFSQTGDRALSNWEERAKQVFNPLELTQTMQQSLLKHQEEVVKRFLKLRQEYVWRKSFL